MALPVQDTVKRPALWAFLALLVLAPIVPGDHQKYIFLGLATGGAYALIAVGYTMVYGIIELINFAHGEIYMFGAYLALTFCLAGPSAYSAVEQVSQGLVFLAGFFGCVAATLAHDTLGRRRVGTAMRYGGAALFGVAFAGVTYVAAHRAVHPMVSCVLAVIWASMLGVVMEMVAYRPLRRAPRLAALITAIGLSLMLQNLAQWMWSASMQPVPDALIPGWLKNDGAVSDAALRAKGAWAALADHGAAFVFGCRITALQLFILVVTILLMVGLTLVIHRTRLGRAMRACAQDRDAAYLMGVDVDRVISWTFALGSALGAVAGILVALYEFKIMPQMGYKAGVVAFAAAVLGGIGNIPGAMLGGIILGIAQAMSVWLELSQWDIGIAYAVMIAIILVQPEGLLGTQTPRKS